MNELTPQEQKMPQLPGMPMMDMPMLPQILQSAMPVPIPQMTYETGMISNFFGNRKRKQIAKSKQYEAEIAEYANREITARLNTMHEIITFSARLQDTFETYKFKSDERTFLREQWAVMLETDKANLIQVQLKNMLLQGEAKLNEIEIKIKLKQMEDILNGTG
jgi:hypothetical protein